VKSSRRRWELGLLSHVVAVASVAGESMGLVCIVQLHQCPLNTGFVDTDYPSREVVNLGIYAKLPSSSTYRTAVPLLNVAVPASHPDSPAFLCFPYPYSSPSPSPP
jgi:hypothetical protein